MSYNGADMEVGFNASYILDAISMPQMPTGAIMFY